MAFAHELFDGNGSNTDFAVNMPYLDKAHITLLVSGTPVTFTWVNATLIRADAAPASGTDNVKVQRTTPNNAALVTFADGSTGNAADDNRAFLQSLYIIQEDVDAAQNYLTEASDTKWDAESKVIKSVADAAAAQDAVTKAQLDAAVILSGNVPTPNNPADDNKALKANAGTFSWQNSGVGKQHVDVQAQDFLTNGVAPWSDAVSTTNVNNANHYKSTLLSGTADEYFNIWLNLPKRWDAGTLSYQIIWTPGAGTADDVTFFMSGRAVADGSTISDYTHGGEVTITDTVVGSSQIMISPESGAVTLSTPAKGRPLLLRVGRKGATDAFDGTCNILAVRIWWTADAENDA